MADVLRRDRRPVIVAAVLPDRHRVTAQVAGRRDRRQAMAQVAGLQDRRRVKAQVAGLQGHRQVKAAVVVLQGNLAAGDLQDHHLVMAEGVTAVVVMAAVGAVAEVTAAATAVGKVVATTSSSTVSRNLSPASGNREPLRRQQRADGDRSITRFASLAPA